MKALFLGLSLASSVFAHPNHESSVHDDDLDLQDAHRDPPAENRVEIKVQGEHRVVDSNGIPDHEVGSFPGKGNPNGIREQDYHFVMPVSPKPANAPIELVRQPFGVALNGVLFDPGTAEYYRNDRSSEWNYEALSGEIDLGLDDHHGHVQPNGAYHYHGLPTGIFERLSGGEKRMTLIGWAADGYPIYGLYGYEDPTNSGSPVVELRSSYRLKEGRRDGGAGSPRGDHDGTFTLDYEYQEGQGDLDECNGRYGVTPEFPDGTYHYVLTKDYPFIPRMFHGEPDQSFLRRGGPEGGRGMGPEGRPPNPFGPPPVGPRGPRGPGGPPRR